MGHETSSAAALARGGCRRDSRQPRATRRGAWRQLCPNLGTYTQFSRRGPVRMPIRTMMRRSVWFETERKPTRCRRREVPGVILWPSAR